MNFELKWAVRDLQNAVDHLQQALAATNKWSAEERECLTYCKAAIDAIVTARLK